MFLTTIGVRHGAPTNGRLLLVMRGAYVSRFVPVTNPGTGLDHLQVLTAPVAGACISQGF